MEGKSLSLNEFSHISHKPESIISKTEKIQACSFTSPITENQNEDKFSQKVNPQTEIEKGKWTREEHRKFIVAILTYGNNWKKVQKFIKTRSCSQARSHAQKFLNKLKHVNFVDFKVTSSLSSISVLQEYILILNKEEKQKFVTFLNDILFEEDFSHINRIENDFVRNKENPRINNIRPNVTVSSSQNNSSCFYYPNSFNYPSGNYLPMTCYTYNTPYNELLYSPHLNNYNYYGYNMNMFNSTEIYPQNYFPASIPICQAPCYSLVQENGQLIYKLIPNFYGVIYPYQQNGFSSQPPFQEQVNLENKRIEFNEKKRKNNNRVFKINKKKKIVSFKLHGKIFDKCRIKIKKKKEKEYICRNHEKDQFITHSFYNKNHDNPNIIDYNPSHCSENLNNEILDYNSQRENSEAYNESDKIETFLDKHCDTEYRSIDNSINIDRITFQKEGTKNSTHSFEDKKEEPLDYFNPTF